jgi:ATP-dependent Clp protease ATP-binding subunit ClpA
VAEWDGFQQAMRGAGLDPQKTIRAIQDHLRRMPRGAGSEIGVSPSMKLVGRLALQYACRAGHTGVESNDLLLALFAETYGAPASIVRGTSSNPGCGRAAYLPSTTSSSRVRFLLRRTRGRISPEREPFLSAVFPVSTTRW